MQKFLFTRSAIVVNCTKEESLPVAELYYKWLQEQNADGAFNGRWRLQDEDETYLISNRNYLFGPDDLSPEQLKKFDEITAAVYA